MAYHVNVDTGPRDAQLGAFTPSAGESFRAAVSSTFNENPTTMLWDAGSLYYANRFGGRRLSREDAQEQVKGAGLNITIPESSYTQEALDIVIARQQEAASRRAIDERTPWGAGSLLRGSAQLITGITDPLNVATAFVPVISQARSAQLLARSESLAGRVAIRGGIGAVEGATGAAMLEPMVYGLHSYMQDDYTMTDSLVNLAFGSALGGVLHSGAGLVNDLAQRAATRAARTEIDRIVANEVEPRNALERVSDAGPVAHEAAFRTAVADAVQGRAPDVEAVVRAISEQERAQNFQRWFAGSKVVDADGKPLVVYHGTGELFDSPQIGYGGMYLAVDPAVADAYAGIRGGSGGGAVLKLHVKAEKVFDPNSEEAADVLARVESDYDNKTDYRDPDDGEYMPLSDWMRSGYLFKLGRDVQNEVMESLRAEGYDAVMYRDASPMTGDSTSLVVFEPSQLKSVENSGRFDPNSASLTDPLDAVKASAARQSDPGALAIGSPDSSRAADERLAAAKSDEMQAAEEKLKEATDYLQALRRNLEAGGIPKERLAKIDDALKAFDDGITDASRLGDALEQYALCGLRQ